jgi:ribose transport system substrate-binding protein
LRTPRTLLILAVVCSLALGFAACGDDEDDRGEAAGSSLSTTAREAYDRAVKGTFASPPSDGPAPQRGKNVWFVTLGVAYDWSTPGSLHDAAKRMGWKLTQFDGKFSTDTLISGIRQAVADGADGIILAFADCPTVKAALRDARAAGVALVSMYAFDCNQADPNERPMFDATVQYRNPGDPDVPMTYPDFLREVWAEAQALAIVDGAGSGARIIDVYESDLLVTVEQDKGVRASLKEYCPGCKIVDTVEFTAADIGPPLQQKIEQSISRHPEADSILSPYDAVTQVTMAAVRASGRKDEIYSVGAEGEVAVMDAIRNGAGTVDAAVGLSPDWEAYSALDALNRIFHGEKPGETGGFPSGNGTQIITAESNLPPAGKRYEPPLDFRSEYFEAWGVK